jgi:hypothetical protein
LAKIEERCPHNNEIYSEALHRKASRSSLVEKGEEELARVTSIGERFTIAWALALGGIGWRGEYKLGTPIEVSTTLIVITQDGALKELEYLLRR